MKKGILAVTCAVALFVTVAVGYAGQIKPLSSPGGASPAGQPSVMLNRLFHGPQYHPKAKIPLHFSVVILDFNNLTWSDPDTNDHRPG